MREATQTWSLEGGNLVVESTRRAAKARRSRRRRPTRRPPSQLSAGRLSASAKLPACELEQLEGPGLTLRPFFTYAAPEQLPDRQAGHGIDEVGRDRGQRFQHEAAARGSADAAPAGPARPRPASPARIRSRSSVRGAPGWSGSGRPRPRSLATPRTAPAATASTPPPRPRSGTADRSRARHRPAAVSMIGESLKDARSAATLAAASRMAVCAIAEIGAEARQRPRS